MDELTRYINEVRDRHNLPALAVAFVQNGKVEKAACGVRKMDDPATTVQPDDAFHYGSCSKAVTAALMHQLIAESQGRITLNSRVGDLLPDIQMHEANRTITIGQLLTHTSGLIGNRELPFEEKKKAVDDVQQQERATSPTEMRKQLTAEFLSQPPEDPSPGQRKFDYGNNNYIILGTIAEKATGNSFENLVQTKIFNEREMHTAGFGQPITHGHRREGDQVIPDQFDNPATLNPAAGMHASVADWLKFLQFEMTKASVVDYPISVSLEAGTEYTSSALFKVRDRLWHNGTNTRNYAEQMLLPRQNAAFVVATNEYSERAITAVREVGKRLLERAMSAHPPLVPKPPTRHPNMGII